MRFASLGSGSRGNATVVEQGTTRVLVDCGFSVTEMQRRLQRLALDAQSLDAIVVTHEHSDHLRGVARLADRFDLPVWLTAGTHAAWKQRDRVSTIKVFSPHEAFAIGALEITPYPVPHDAREPCQFVFSDGEGKLGILSDIGKPTPLVCEMLHACHALLLECNHDADMLARGPYPPQLKQRVGGPLGHLNNEQSAQLLGMLDVSKLQHLVAVHISEKNNTVALARQALAGVLDCAPDWIGVADQDEGFAWRSIAA